MRRILEEQFERAKKVLLDEREALDRVVKYLIEYERITGEEFEKIFRNEPVELMSYKERRETLEKPDEPENGEEPEREHQDGEKPEQRYYRPGEVEEQDE